MKVGKLAVGYLLVFVVLLSFVVFTIQSEEPIPINAYIRPDEVNLEEAAPACFYVYLSFPRGSDAEEEDINRTTIRVEGTIEPLPPEETPWKMGRRGGRRTRGFVFGVDGQELVDVIWSKVYHMGIPPGDWEEVSLQVTGQLYDGTDFEGTMTVEVYYSNPEPPPPP